VNARTLDIDDVLMPGRDVGALVRTSVGTNGFGISTMAAGGWRYNDALSLMGAVVLHDQGSYYSGDSEGKASIVHQSDEDIKAGLVKIDLTPDATQSLRLGANLHNSVADL